MEGGAEDREEARKNIGVEELGREGKAMSVLLGAVGEVDQVAARALGA